MFNFVSMRRLTTTVLFLLYTLFAQASAEDTVLARLMRISNDTQRMNAYLDYADKVLIDNPKEVISLGKIFLQDARASGKLLHEAAADKMIAEGYDVIADYPRALQYFLEALRIHKELKEYRSQVTDLLGIARVYELTDDMPAQRKCIEEAMTISDQHADNERVRQKRPFVLDYLATVYKKEGRYDTAIKLYNDAIVLARKEGNKFQEMESLCNMAIALKSDKRYDESLATYNKAMALVEPSDEGYAESIISDNMAILFFEMGDLRQSELYALKAMTLQQKLHITEGLKDVYETLVKIYTKEKKYPEALDYSMKLTAIKDSILNGEKSQQIKQLQTKFDTEAKD